MIHQFINYLRYTKRYSENTLRSYNNALVSFVEYRRSTDLNARWSTTMAIDVQNYLASMVRDGKSNTTICLHASAIRQAFRFIVMNGGDIDKAIYNVETPKVVKSDAPVIAKEDIEATINDEMIATDTRIIIAIIADCGLRISEVLSLRKTSFDKSAKVITINGKGGKTRYAYYSDRVREMLNKYKASISPADYLFKGDERNIRYRIHMSLRLHSNAPKLSPHIIRHTYATESLNNGMNIAALKMQLGHKDIKSTECYLNHYRLHSYDSYRAAL